MTKYVTLLFKTFSDRVSRQNKSQRSHQELQRVLFSYHFSHAELQLRPAQAQFMEAFLLWPLYLLLPCLPPISTWIPLLLSWEFYLEIISQSNISFSILNLILLRSLATLLSLSSADDYFPIKSDIWQVE